MGSRDFSLSKEARLKYYLFSALALFVIGILFYNNYVVGLVLTSLSIVIEKYYKNLLAVQCKQKINIEFKDMLISMSASFTAGRQMTDAIFEARSNLLLIFPSDSPINVELETLTKRLKSGVEKEKDILYDFANRSESDDILSFVDVYYTCLTTGGDIVKAVNRAVEIIIEKMSIRKEFETLMAQKKYEARILTLIPVVILAFLRFNSPEYLDKLYGNPLGILIMTAAIGCLAASFVWSNKIMEIKL